MPTTITNTASTQEKLLRARDAAAKLALLSTDEKNALLLAIADAIEAHAEAILAANRKDVESSGLDGAMRDRLLLTQVRIKEMAQGVRDVVALPDPIGETLGSGRARTACASAKCVCRWASWESSTNPGRTLLWTQPRSL